MPGSTNTAESTVENLADEDLDGFAAVSASQIRVSGSRTVGLFVIAAADARVDNATITASLRDSMKREAQSFAGITSFDVVSDHPGPVSAIRAFAVGDAARFDEMALPGARFADTGGASGPWLVSTSRSRRTRPEPSFISS